jgi:hypothetical protein
LDRNYLKTVNLPGPKEKFSNFLFWFRLVRVGNSLDKKITKAKREVKNITIKKPPGGQGAVGNGY